MNQLLVMAIQEICELQEMLDRASGLIDEAAHHGVSFSRERREWVKNVRKLQSDIICRPDFANKVR